MYLFYEQVVASDATKNIDDLNIPHGATHAELQADTQHVRYTMGDGSPAPTQSTGMILLTTEGPKLFLIEDVKAIKFVRGAGSNGNLNIHYLGGRDL